MAASVFAGARQRVANFALAGWIAADAVRIAQLADRDGVWTVDAAVILALVVAAIFVLIRPAPARQDGSPVTVIVALAAASFPLLYLLLPPLASLATATIATQWVAVAIMLVATLALGQNYSILPQYRWLVRHGPYAYVRHPLYASYLAFDGALALQHPSVLAVTLWIAEAILFDWRARREEALLARSDEDYLSYMSHVPWRFVPHVL
jgi:protein-S-isoprenylcysteine O-methyltransferase Ste14